MAARVPKYSGKNLVIQARNVGSRQYYEHDDRGMARSSGGGSGRGNFRYHNSGGRYRGGRGGRTWDANWEDGRSSRFVEGHWRGNKRGSNRGGHGPRRPQYKDDDTEMTGSREKNRRQDMYKRRGGRAHVNNHNNNRMGWYKAMIKDGVKYDRHEVLEGIRSLVHEPFIPVLYEVEGKSLVFYLEDNGPAVQAISEINRRLTMANGEKLSIFFNRSPPPNRPLTQPQREQVMQVMSARYSPEMKRLDLKNFHNDTTLVKESIFCPLYRQPNMQIVVNIIMEHIPHVEEIDLSHNKITCLDELDRLMSSCTNLHRLSLKKNKLTSPESLDKLSGMQITDLTLEDNPLCDRFRDTESYIRQVHWVSDPG